jgi:hypothetical protein
MASRTLWLSARTRGSGEKCRGSWHASPREESVTREREKKGAVVMGRLPFTGGTAEQKLGGTSREWCHTAGGREGCPDGTWREGR